MSVHPVTTGPDISPEAVDHMVVRLVGGLGHDGSTAAMLRALRSALTASEKDAARYRWLTEDHADRDVRASRSAILERMSVMSYSAASYAIDAAMEKANG